MNSAAKVDSYATDFDAKHPNAALESHEILLRLEGAPMDSATFAVGPILDGEQSRVGEDSAERANFLLSDLHHQFRAQGLPKKEHPDHLVTRAYIAAFLGFVTIPIVLHAYSAWMLLTLDKTTISPETRYRYALAWAGNLLAFGLIFGWLAARLSR